MFSTEKSEVWEDIKFQGEKKLTPVIISLRSNYCLHYLFFIVLTNLLLIDFTAFQQMLLA